MHLRECRYSPLEYEFFDRLLQNPSLRIEQRGLSWIHSLGSLGMRKLTSDAVVFFCGDESDELSVWDMHLADGLASRTQKRQLSKLFPDRGVAMLVCASSISKRPVVEPLVAIAGCANVQYRYFPAAQDSWNVLYSRANDVLVCSQPHYQGTMQFDVFFVAGRA